MRVPGRRHLTNRRGATLPLVALMMVALLSIVALVADLGMAMSARGDAQRAADAAALAGVSTYTEAAPSEAEAETRARDYATRNHLLGRAILDDEIMVGVDAANMAVTVQLQRTLPTAFARIFGVNETDVGATATARVTMSGTAACVRPFAFPNTIYTEADYGQRVKLWEQKDDGDGFVLIGHDGSPPGLGNIRPMISDTDCSGRTLSTGSAPYRAPDDTRLGQVRNGFADLIESDAGLTWSPTGPHNGFNRPDYLNSNRVGVVPVYDPATSNGTPGGTGVVHITGFLLVYFSDMDRTPPPQPHDRVWGVILRATGVSDVCDLGTCTPTTPVIQLVN